MASDGPGDDAIDSAYAHRAETGHRQVERVRTHRLYGLGQREPVLAAHRVGDRDAAGRHVAPQRGRTRGRPGRERAEPGWVYSQHIDEHAVYPDPTGVYCDRRTYPAQLAQPGNQAGRERSRTDYENVGLMQLGDLLGNRRRCVARLRQRLGGDGVATRAWF